MVSFTPDVVGMNRADTKWFQKTLYLDLVAHIETAAYQWGNRRVFSLLFGPRETLCSGGLLTWRWGTQDKHSALVSQCGDCVAELSQMDSPADVSVAPSFLWQTGKTYATVIYTYFFFSYTIFAPLHSFGIISRWSLMSCFLFTC